MCHKQLTCKYHNVPIKICSFPTGDDASYVSPALPRSSCSGGNRATACDTVVRIALAGWISAPQRDNTVVDVENTLGKTVISLFVRFVFEFVDIILGLIFYNDFPDIPTLIGAFVITVSGIYTLYIKEKN